VQALGQVDDGSPVVLIDDFPQLGHHALGTREHDGRVGRKDGRLRIKRPFVRHRHYDRPPGSANQRSIHLRINGRRP